MSFFWFIAAVVFFVLFLKKNISSLDGDEVDYSSKTYAQGYWNGFRAHQKEAGIITDDINIATSDNSMSTQTLNPTVSEGPVVETTDQKAKRDLQNINTALYVGSFLLVAAAGLFIGTTLPESIRFIGVWFVTIMFYSAGLILHKYVIKLRPAAIAFAGTGLAILPFTGIAMYNFVLPNASWCWFITSMIGLIAFVLAAVTLRSQIVAYFAIAFAVSMATSSVATIGAGLIWYFVVLIIFGAMLTFISKIKHGLIPEYFSGPIQNTNSWIVPLTLLASLLSVFSLSLQDYWVITLSSTLYYMAVAISTPSQRKLSIFFVRALLSISMLLMTYDFLRLWDSVGVVLTVIGLFHVLISALMTEKYGKDSFNDAWLWIGFLLQLIASLFIFVNPDWSVIVSLQLLALLLVSFGLSYYLRRSELSGFGILSLAVLPVVVCLYVVKPAIDSHWLSLIFVLFSIVTILIRSLKSFNDSHPSIREILLVGFVVFACEALISTFGVSLGWGFGVWFVLSGLIYALVYIERQPWLSVIGNIIFLISIIWLTFLVEAPDKWRTQIISWVIMAAFYAIYLLATDMSKKVYGVYFWWSAVIVGSLINLSTLGIMGYSYYSGTNSLIFSAAIGALSISAIMAVEGWKSRRLIMIDAAAILATIGLQKVISVSMPEINWLVYTHWWAMVFAGLSYFYYKVGKNDDSNSRSIIALIIITFFTGIQAITATGVSGSPYRLIFLIEHVVVLIAGLALSRKLFTIWGAVGVILAILWMISGYTFLVLIFIAAILIGVAIYALIRQSKKG